MRGALNGVAAIRAESISLSLLRGEDASFRLGATSWLWERVCYKDQAGKECNCQPYQQITRFWGKRSATMLQIIALLPVEVTQY